MHRPLNGLLVASLLTAGAAGAAPERIENPAAPPRTDAVVLTERWRAGGEDDEDILLGQIGSAATDAAGNVYVLDTQLAHVLKFGPEGGHVATLGREGDGPGEMRQPIDLDVTPDGAVRITQPFPGRIVRLAPDGTPEGDVTFGGDSPTEGGFAMVTGARERAGHLVAAGQRSAFDMASGEIRGTQFLSSVAADGGEIARHAEVATTRNMTRIEIHELDEYFPGDRGLWDLDRQGRLYAATSYADYEITVTAPDGTVERVITRPHEPRRRSEQEKEELQDSVAMNINGREPEIVHHLEDAAPCIRSLRVLDDGTLWVENSHARDRWDDEGVLVYDVFGPDGRLMREVAVTVPGGDAQDRPILLADGRFLLAVGQADLSISISAGSGDGEPGEAPVAAVMPELVCFGPVD